jgi:hypothetical protein
MKCPMWTMGLSVTANRDEGYHKQPGPRMELGMALAVRGPDRQHDGAHPGGEEEPPAQDAAQQTRVAVGAQVVVVGLAEAAPGERLADPGRGAHAVTGDPGRPNSPP